MQRARTALNRLHGGATTVWCLQRLGRALPGAPSPCSGEDGSSCLVQPCLRESLSQCPGLRSGLVRGSLGLALLDSGCRKLKRQQKEGQVEKTTEEERMGGRETNAPGCCTRPTRIACAGTNTSRPVLPAFCRCQRIENGLRGGDRASPPDLNLSDKTRAFQKEKKKPHNRHDGSQFQKKGCGEFGSY